MARVKSDSGVMTLSQDVPNSPRTNVYPSVGAGAEIPHGGRKVIPNSHRPSLDLAEPLVASRVAGEYVSWDSPIFC